MINISRLPSRALLLAIILLFGLPAYGQQQNGPSEAQALLTVHIERTDLLALKANDILRGLGAEEGGDGLLAVIGSFMDNPQLAGVDVKKPITFYQLSVKDQIAFAARFHPFDREALQWSLFFREVRERQSSGEIRFKGDVAAWAMSGEAAEAALEIEDVQAGGTEGSINLLLHISDYLKADAPRFQSELDAMRRRMEEALSRVEGSEGAVRAAQRQLNRTVGLLRQMDRLEFSIHPVEGGVSSRFSLSPVAGTPAALFINAAESNGLTLTEMCPPDADLVVAHNVFPAQSIGSMALGLFGLDAEEQESTSEALTALILASDSGPVEVVDIRKGKAADSMERKWRGAVSASTTEYPFVLRPVPAPDGEDSVRMAQLVPSGDLLPQGGIAILQYLLGEVILAAQERNGSTLITSLGTTPIRRLREIRALAGHPEGGLAREAYFQRSMDALPSPSNAIVYVSPEGIKRWLSLGGISTGIPRFGLAAGVVIKQGRIEGDLLIPTDFLSISSQNGQGL